MNGNRHLITLLFVVVMIFLGFGAFDVMASRRIESVIARPALVITGVSTSVRIVSEIAPDPDLLVSSVTLIKVGSDGRSMGIVGNLYDDGTHGDTAPTDNIFTTLLQVHEPSPTTIRLRVSVAYKRTLLRTLSEILTISITEAPFFTPPDPTKIVNEDGMLYPVNHVVIALPEGVGRSVAGEIASEIGATIIGFVPSINSYTLEAHPNTIAELNALIATLSIDPRISVVTKNILVGFDTINNDLSHLRGINPQLTAAYDKLMVQEAWDFISGLSSPLNPVKIGILDTGLDSSHPEFNGVSLGDSPSDAFSPSLSHGSSVAGIIGANNLSGIASLTPDNPHMNGIVAGIPSISSTSGSRISYTLEIRKISTADQVFAEVDSLAVNGVSIINMSFGNNLCEGFMFICDLDLNYHPISRDVYGVLVTLWSRSFAVHRNITFVGAAGNAGGGSNLSAENNVPGGLLSSNLITVASTDLNDQRSSFSQFGSRIDIAAPGEEVYAPSFFTFPLDTSDYDHHFGGTSASAPMTTGTVALLLALRESLTPQQITRILQISGDSIVTDKPIGGKRLNAFQAVKFVSKPVDVFFLVDMTGSFVDDLTIFKAGAASLINDLVQSGLNIHFGLGRFEDYPFAPWGDAPFGDRAYQRVLDIAPPGDLDGNGNLDILDAIQSLSTRSGFDFPEAQLPALFQAATGAGQDVHPTGASLGDIPSGQQANIRPDSVRIVVLWTDAVFHRPGDSVATIGGVPVPYPGPSFSDTIAALNSKNLKVIGIASGGGSVISDLRIIATGTDTLAPQGGVDCDGNGTIDIPAGQPMICSISSNGTGISQAIKATVLAIAN